MIVKWFMLVLMVCGICSQGSLVIYCDFESRNSDKASNAAGAAPLVRAEKGGLYANEAPAVIAGRSRFSFDLGAGFMAFRSGDSPALGENWSLNCFLRTREQGGDIQTLFHQHGDWSMHYRPEQGRMEFSPRGGKSLSFDFQPHTGWQMITLVKNGSKLAFFIDGRLQGERELAAALTRTGALFIGSASATGSKRASALIDDLAFWSRALAPEEIAALAAGTPAVGIAAGDRLSRRPVPPFSPETTAVYHLNRGLDLNRAVIVPNDGPAGMELAEKVQRELQTHWQVTIPIRRVTHHADGNENLILCGGPTGNILSRELTANQQLPEALAGAEYRVYPEALDWKRGVVFVGGRDDEEIIRAAGALGRHFSGKTVLPFTIHTAADPGLFVPDAPVAKTRTHFAGAESKKVNNTLDTYMREAFEAYRATGDDRHVTAFVEMLRILARHYPDTKYRNMPPTFQFHLFPQYLYLLENSPAFADADRIVAAELTRTVMEESMNCWELQAPAAAYAAGKTEYFTNHYCFAARTVCNAGRYLRSRYQSQEADYFIAVGENVFAGVAKVPLGPEDAGGYQHLVYRIYMDYWQSTGRLDPAMFRDPAFVEYVEYSKSLFNHLGYTPGYGDAHIIGIRGAFVPLRKVMEMNGDPEVERLMAMIARRVDSGFYDEMCRRWGVDRNLPVIDSPRFNGLRVFTVNPIRAQLLGLMDTKLPKLDKAVFRSSWRPDADFLAVNGLNGSPHGHDDAIGISQYLAGEHLWLIEGNYIRRAVEDHNLISVIRDGFAPHRVRGRIPNTERFAQVVGQAVNERRDTAVLSLLLENYNGVDYFRHICYQARKGFWVIDELLARQPGQYRFAAYFRTTGDMVPHPQGVLVRQKPAGKKDPFSVFSIAEGSGAARFGIAELERGQGNGIYLKDFPFSDQLVKTRIFWKDAALKTGEKSRFVSYFRAMPDGTAEPVSIETLGADMFAAGSGENRTEVRLDQGVRFMTAAGELHVPAPSAAADRSTASSGEIVANAPLPPPPPAAARRRAEPVQVLDAEISAVAGSKSRLGVGLSDGRFLLLDPAGAIVADVRLPGEISAIGVIPTPRGEFFAVGCRPSREQLEKSLVSSSEFGPGTLVFFDADGKKQWSREIIPYLKRDGAPLTIFPARLDGRDAPPAIVVGAESNRYVAFGPDGSPRWTSIVIHSAAAGAAADFDGDGRDEIYAGTEYYSRGVLDFEGKELTRTKSSPWDTAALIAAVPGNGPKLVFAARRDGFLYAESHDDNNQKWVANLGGPAYGLAALPNAIAAATWSGYLTLTDGDGKRIATLALPAPLTDLALSAGNLYAPGLDGRVYAAAQDGSRVIEVIDCAEWSGDERFRPRLAAVGDRLFAVFGKRIFQVK
jgi:hypothetical protein